MRRFARVRFRVSWANNAGEVARIFVATGREPELFGKKARGRANVAIRSPRFGNCGEFAWPRIDRRSRGSARSHIRRLYRLFFSIPFLSSFSFIQTMFTSSTSRYRRNSSQHGDEERGGGGRDSRLEPRGGALISRIFTGHRKSRLKRSAPAYEARRFSSLKYDPLGKRRKMDLSPPRKREKKGERESTYRAQGDSNSSLRGPAVRGSPVKRP